MRSVLFLFLSFMAFAQQSRLQGKWILDNVTYDNGKALELNHPEYSTFLQFDLDGDSLRINEQSFPVQVAEKHFKYPFGTMEYKTKGSTATIQKKGDNRLYHFVALEEFLKANPEFEPKAVSAESPDLYYTNDVVKPAFIAGADINRYLRQNIPGFRKYDKSNLVFKANFVVTKDSRITHINIEKGISPEFDKEFFNALSVSQKYWRNSFGKDFLIKQHISFFARQKKNPDPEFNLICEIIDKAENAYQKADFKTAGALYDKFSELNILPETKEKFKDGLARTYLNAGVTNLILNKPAAACANFRTVGGIEDFRIRNYLKNYCH